MKLTVFFVKQVILLGSAGFLAWVAASSLRFGYWAWASDAPQAWLFALFLVACYLLLIAAPLQILCRNLPWRFTPYIVGLASGPIAVVVALFLFSRYPVGFEYYIRREVLLHGIFAAIGLWFAFNFTRLRPNNSFKPKPLRGSA